jgi:hypothetical protein
MGSAARVLVSITYVLFVTSCEKWTWPPYERPAQDLFEENQTLFETIRQNMEIDGLETMSDVYARGKNRVRAGQEPAILSADLQAKYSALIAERSAFRYELAEDHFIVDVNVPPVKDHYFNFAYVSGALESDIPNCSDMELKDAECGRCFVPLKEDWVMIWSWFPIEPEDQDESCKLEEDDA